MKLPTLRIAVPPTASLALGLLATPLVAQDLAPRTPVDLAPLVTGTSGAPSVALSTDAACVAWAQFEFGNGEVWSARSNGRGVNWQAPVRVDTDITGATKITNPYSVQRGDSTVWTFWLDSRSSATTEDVRFNVSNDDGASFAPLDAAIPDGYGGLGDVRAFRPAIVSSTSGDAVLVVMRVAPAGVFDEELFVTRSTDGGATWSTPLRLAGDSGQGHDVDQFDLAVDGDTVHLVWEDDSANGAGRYSTYHARSTDGGVTWSAPTALDAATDPTDAGNSDAPGDNGLRVRSDGAQVAVAWLEERTHPDNEEVRLALSTNSGQSFAADFHVGAGDPNTVDVDYLDLWMVNDQLLVAFTDNRASGGTLDGLFVWRRHFNGSQSTEVGLSNAAGGAFPRFCGAGDQVALTWHTDNLRQSLIGRISENAGATWLPRTVLYDSLGVNDVDNATACFDAGYDNLLAAFLADVGPVGENRVLVSGVRPPTIVPLGFDTGSFYVGFQGLNLIEDDDQLFCVVVALSQAEGAFLLPDTRDTGLAYDVFTSAGLTLLPSLLAPVNLTGNASTPLLVNNLPPGLTFQAVGVTLDALGQTQRVTDVATVVVGP